VPPLKGYCIWLHAKREDWRVAGPWAFEFRGAALFAGYAKGALFRCARPASTRPLQPLPLALRPHIVTLVTMMCANKIGSGKGAQGRARNHSPQLRGSSRLDTPAPKGQSLIPTHAETESPVNHRKQRRATCSNPYTLPGAATAHFDPLFDYLCASVTLWLPALTAPGASLRMTIGWAFSSRAQQAAPLRNSKTKKQIPRRAGPRPSLGMTVRRELHV